MSNDLRQEMCQTFVRNLLDCHRHHRSSSLTFYVRELWGIAAACDQFAYLSPVRRDIEKSMNQVDERALTNILAYEDTERDRQIALGALWHHRIHHQQLLQQTMTWSSWLQHHTLDRMEGALKERTRTGAC